MEITVSEILKSPGAVLLYQSLHDEIEHESLRRNQYRTWLTEDTKAEFINGQIFIHSPSIRREIVPTQNIFTLLSTFVSIKELGETAYERATVTLSRNDYQPDICFWENHKSSVFTDDTELFSAPDFVVEVISKCSEGYDRKIKFEDYALHGVREYWIIDPDKQTVEQYALLVPTDKSYLPYGKFIPGDYIKSIALPEFEIPVAAIFDEKANFEALKKLME